MDNVYAQRVSQIRDLMRENGWDAVVISGSDPHSSEYVAPRWQQVQWISGFTGEAGEVVITADHAGLWTDTRYFIQAGKQLPGTGIELHKTNVPDQVLIPEWLAQKLGENSTPVIAVDGLCQTISSVKEITDAFIDAGNDRAVVKSIPDMLDTFWRDRPAVPETPVTTLDVKYCGLSRVEKLAWIRQEMKKSRCCALLLTSLDEIAWLLNVRGSDIAYNPVIISHLLVTENAVQWFVKKSDHADGITACSFTELESDGIELRRYDEISGTLSAMSGRLLVDPSTLNYSLYMALQSSAAEMVTGTSPVILKKSIKNDVEIAGMRECHIADGVAVVRFLHWLEKEIKSGRTVSEWEAAEKLGAYRSENALYRGDSFETISAWGEGAALPHYVTPQDGSTVIGNHGLYLVDSGGQYLNGTTDITRTVPMGPCTDLEKEDYTLALQGHIRLALCVFPKGTAGCQIDVLAREPLWRTCRNFGHGTGHGVGFYLNVHEGPQNIRQGFKNQPLLPGMITSNEPGLYREGMHGIRHENLILCVDTGRRDFGREWLAFEDLTVCYFDTSALIPALLHDDERKWLNNYNERVYQILTERLNSDDAAWLRNKTLPI